MANEFTFFQNLIDSKILNLHTAFLAKIENVDETGRKAIVKPLTMVKPVNGKAFEQSVVSAVIGQNAKMKAQTITYRNAEEDTDTITVLVPDVLKVGDIVYVGVCERDITSAKNGVISYPNSKRHHNINDGVILAVL